jgi:hypothetical protein
LAQLPFSFIPISSDVCGAGRTTDSRRLRHNEQADVVSICGIKNATTYINLAALFKKICDRPLVSRKPKIVDLGLFLG